MRPRISRRPTGRKPSAARLPTFRTRLMVAMSALALGVLALTAGAVYLGVRQALLSNLDAALLSLGRAEIAAALVGPGGAVRVRAEDPAPLSLSGLSGYEKFAQIEDASGHVLARTGNLTRDLSPGTQSLPERRARRGHSTIADIPIGGERLRCLYYPLTDHQGRSLLAIVGISETPMEGSLGSLRDVLLASFVGGVAAVATGAALLSRRMTDPLRQIADAARAIGDTNLNARIPHIAADQELRDLTAVLNAMLARLEGAFTAQRRFVGDASHELRSPLTNLRCMVEFALRRPRTPDDYRETLTTAQVEIVRLSRLAGDLLTLSRADAGQFSVVPAACDLSSLIRQAVVAHAADAERCGVALEGPEDGGGSVLALGDYDRLRQVADNLLGNALRYAPPGSAVRIEAWACGERVRLEVRDAGPGIAERDHAQIFERFYRADPSRDRASGGSGLGLAIVKTIAEAHSGGVRVVSRPGAGACFIVDLPAAP